jgi:peptidyl-prolyl cis-trans isomerase B (cyclophilin B)
MEARNIKFILLILIISVIVLIGGCKKEEIKEVEKIEKMEEQGGQNMELNQLQLPSQGEEIAIITTNYGNIKIRLFPEAAPKSVENFKTHARNGYYNKVTFHRVINDFMIQGGDPEGTGRGGESIWGEPFEDEFDINYRNFRGALSMANAGPNTNGSQFFIVQKHEVEKDIIDQMKEAGEEKGFPESVVKAYEELGGTYWLDGRHTVFGQVFEGMDVVDKIAEVEVGGNDKPLEPVVMEKVEIVEFK